MPSKQSRLDRHTRPEGPAHPDTETLKHRHGGPGKSARKGHLDPGDSGNKPGQEQAGAGHEHGRPDVDRPHRRPQDRD